MIDKSIRKLVCYGLEKGFFTKRDEIYVTNRIMELLELDGIDCNDCFTDIDLNSVLEEILDFAAQKGLFEDGITARDLFDTKLMGAMLPRPSEVTHEFYERYERSAKEATDWYYNFSCDTNYIRRDRIAKDVKWLTPTEYGELDITINLSKPGKDPRDIAKEGQAKKSGYPACLLCKENVGY